MSKRALFQLQACFTNEILTLGLRVLCHLLTSIDSHTQQNVHNVLVSLAPEARQRVGLATEPLGPSARVYKASARHLLSSASGAVTATSNSLEQQLHTHHIRLQPRRHEHLERLTLPYGSSSLHPTHPLSSFWTL